MQDELDPADGVYFRSCGAGEVNQDSAGAFRCGDALILVVADGSGGSSEGAFAAQRLLTWLQETLEESAILGEPLAWADRLSQFDEALYNGAQGGEAGGVIAAIHRGRVVGASTGHAHAWLLRPDGTHVDLTARQYRRPLLGTGVAMPVAFGPEPMTGTLLLASDGLTNYAPRERVLELTADPFPDLGLEALLALPCLPGGGLQDDVSVLLYRAPGCSADGETVESLDEIEEIVIEGGIDGEPA